MMNKGSNHLLNKKFKVKQIPKKICWTVPVDPKEIQANKKTSITDAFKLDTLYPNNLQSYTKSDGQLY